jgi:hypothetical protein
MSILDAYRTLSASSVPLEKEKYENFVNVVKEWVDAWPTQLEAGTVLRASGISDLCPREFILNYWSPKPAKPFNFSSYFAMSIGTHLHSYIQNSVLGPMGILKGVWLKVGDGSTVEGFHPDPEHALEANARQEAPPYLYVEPSYFHPLYRISGHSDGIIDVSRFQYLESKKNKIFSKAMELCTDLQSVGGKETALLEIKTVNSYVYKKTMSSSDIPDYYKMQAAIYQGLSGIRTTFFWYMERDTCASKIIQWSAPSSWWYEARQKARIVWESIRDRKLPEVFQPCKTEKDTRAKKCPHRVSCFTKWGVNMSFEHWTRWCERQQKNRQFLDLSGVVFPEI